MEHGIAIRHAVAGDLDRIVELERQAEAAAHWPRAAYEAMILADVVANPKRVLFVAERGGEIAGFAAARAVLSEAHPPECELENIAVSAQALRRGVGRALLLRICEWARGLGAHELDAEVRASNVAALGLYLATGFAKVGRRPLYYSAPMEDAVLLKLHL